MYRHIPHCSVLYRAAHYIPCCTVQDDSSGEIVLYMKGADTVMAAKVEYNDWLDEECTNLAQKGLRTLVVARKVLTEEQYTAFEVRVGEGGR